jgi:hypothetical protein
MQTEREEQPISSKPGSRPVESEGDPVSLRDIEMILAPGISPPPLPTLARAPSKLPAPRRPVEPPAAEAPKAAPRWTAEAAPLRRRKERSPATAPDAAFQGLRLTPTPHEPKAAEGASKGAAAKPNAAPPAHGTTNPEHPRALPVPHVKAPVITAPSDAIDVTLEGEDGAPPSGLLDLRTMIPLREEAPHKSSHFDDEVLNLTGGIMGIGTASPLLSPLPPPIDEGPRADEDEVLSLPTPGTSPKKLLAPVIPLGAEPEEAVEPSFPLGDPETLARDKVATTKSAAEKKTAKSAETKPQASAERSKLPWLIATGAVAVAVWMVLRPAPTAPPALPSSLPPPPPIAAEQAPTPPAAVTTAAPTAIAPTAAETAAPAPSTKEAEPALAANPGTTKPEAAKPEAAKPEAAKPEAAKPEAAPTPVPEAPAPPPPSSGPEFDKAAANAALGSAAGAASGCRAPDDPQGTARVSVKFAPSGRVTSALVSGPPFAGTATGSCIAKAFRGISVPPFSGDPVTVSKSINIR